MRLTEREGIVSIGQRPLRVTERLQQARESRGVSHRQIADAAKVSTRIIAALESARLDVVPGGIYRRALVRLFASEVGLPPEETLRAFLAEHPDDLPLPGAGPIAETGNRRWFGAWRRALAMLGAVVPLLIGVAYFGRAVVPAPRQPLLPTASRDAGAWRPEIVPAGGFSEAPPPAARPVAMLITISARCELRVTADGSLVVGRWFEPGESFRGAFSDAVEMAGDKAGAVQYSLNGRAGQLLGTAGEMLSVRIGREDYPLLLSGR
jgi:transcriptional regulator with XRE-family HTH domain